ncbi:unnamed protein product, partial [Didymodactylos carnosus]
NTKSCESSLPTLSTLALNAIIESINTISSEEQIEESKEEIKDYKLPYQSTLLNHTEWKRSDRNDFKSLLQIAIATADTHFLSDGQLYRQMTGVAMGSPVASILANIFMCDLEHAVYSQLQSKSVKYYTSRRNQ